MMSWNILKVLLVLVLKSNLKTTTKINKNVDYTNPAIPLSKKKFNWTYFEF